MEPPAFPDHIVRYKCGTCGQERRDFWSWCQLHYENHLKYQKEGEEDDEDIPPDPTPEQAGYYPHDGIAYTVAKEEDRDEER